MKKHILLIALIATSFIFASCQKERNESSDNSNKVTLTFVAGTPDTKTNFGAKESNLYPTLWQSGDKMGVSANLAAPASFDLTVSADFKTATATGSVPAAATYYAFVPFSAYVNGSVNTTNNTIDIAVPHEQTPTATSVDPAAQIIYSSAAPAAGDKVVNLQFKHALAYGKMTLNNLSLPAGATINAVVLDAPVSLAGKHSLNMTNGTFTSVEPDNNLSIKTTSNSDLWFSCVPADLAGKTLTVIVNTTKGLIRKTINCATLHFDAGKVSEFPVNMSGATLIDDISVNYVYFSNVDGGNFAPQSPAIDRNGNAYFTLRYTKNLYKVGPDGTLVWKTNLAFTDAGSRQYTSASVEPDGSFVYAGGGRNGAALLKKINGADGSVVWTFEKNDFYSSTGTHTPNLWRSAPAIGENNIYIDNTGTTGTVLSISKETGKRVAYVSNSDGSNAPSGGVGEPGVAISNAGTIGSVMKKGHYAFNKAEMDNPTNTHTTDGGYVPYGYYYNFPNTAFNSGVIATKINGTNAFAYYLLTKSSSGVYDGRVIATDASLGLKITAPAGISTGALIDYTIPGIADMGSEGGIVVGNNMELIVSLRTTGGKSGGIFAVGQDGKKAYEFLSTSMDVNGCPAVDNNGYVHFVDNAGYYHIVKPDLDTHTCTELFKMNMWDIIKMSGGDISRYKNVTGWTTVIIGYDGKIYLGANYGNKYFGGSQAAILCLNFKETTSPSTVSPWPMRYADCSHTGNQQN